MKNFFAISLEVLLYIYFKFKCLNTTAGIGRGGVVVRG